MRTDDFKALKISWDPIIPDHTKGEGDIFSYEVEYRNKKIRNAIVSEQVFGNSAYIEGLYFVGVYEVRVRCVVIVQSIPLPTLYMKGRWSDWVESRGQEPVTPGE